MKYIRSFILLVSLMVFTISLNAQETQSKSDKEQEFKSQKIAFFTDKIGLTPEEAQIFWPVYNDYWAKKNKIIADRKEKMTYFADNSENMSHKEFKKILPINKVMKIYLADYEFKTYLLKKIRESGKNKETD